MPISLQQALRDSISLRNVSESSALDTELLLSYVTGKSREYLRTHSEESLSIETYDKFQYLMLRRKQGEPIAYILGNKEFWDFDLKVNKSVLIPRPETEFLVEQTLAKLKNKFAPLRIADLGTGSGAIAIAIARKNSGWQIDAVDISEDALLVARENAAMLQVSNIEFHLGSWCDGLPKEQYDLIVANPPYVAPEQKLFLGEGLSFEPSVALVAEDLGFAALDTIIRTAKFYLKKDAWLLMEHGHDQQKKLVDSLKDLGYKNVAGHKDYAGIDRIVECKWI
ncbi:MAG: protein-(glutamine-N5) methyltransferase, release factor-specific [Gammaproteobacteria bacterium]|nr:protein-(glutamine-N5) methyltransferase, release factor-specific [Gammaproteobacteria bacterium]|tara:strand:- start:1530 stop:2372 length:843 start_codon:yes stop_codon:yes gene_type:complete